MKEYLKVDLRIARQHSGLKGTDVATLLGIGRARLSKLQNGFARPRVKEVIGLSLIYGKPLDELFQLSSSRLTDKLQDRLASIDHSERDTPLRQARSATLASLADRLQTLKTKRYDA